MYEKAQDILIVLCYLLILIRLIKTCQSYHNRILYDADDDQSCKRKDLRWWSRKAAGWLALENGFNAMNGFNVSPVSSGSQWLYLPNQQTLLGAFVQCFVQDCPFVATTGHKNSVSANCGPAGTLGWTADFFASSLHGGHLGTWGGPVLIHSN